MVMLLAMNTTFGLLCVSFLSFLLAQSLRIYLGVGGFWLCHNGICLIPHNAP